MKNLPPDVGELASIPRAKTFLQNRHDLCQHFFTSTALAVEGRSTLSQAIRLYKEVDDSRGGSGFSFPDWQVDNAGTLFGELAIKSKSSAKQLQKIAGENLTEITLLPNVDGLPYGLTEAEFKARYGEVGTALTTKCWPKYLIASHHLRSINNRPLTRFFLVSPRTDS